MNIADALTGARARSPLGRLRQRAGSLRLCTLPAAVPPRRRAARAFSRRELAVCAGLLSLIVVTAVVSTWFVWASLKDAQVQLQPGSPSETSSSSGSRLETDLTEQSEHSLLADRQPASSVRRSAPPPRVKDAPSLAVERGSDGVTVDGKAVALLATLVVAGAVAGAGRLLLSRYRRGAVDEATLLAAPEAWRSSADLERDAEPDDVLVSAAETDVSTDSVPDDSADSDRHASTGRDHQPAGPEPAQRVDVAVPAASAERARGGLLEPHERRSESLALEPDVSAWGRGEPVDPGDALVPAQRSSWATQQEAAAPAASVRPVAPSAFEGTSAYELKDDDTSAERIFDRREARRIPYVQSAWMWSGDADGPVTVQDLSATGLRCAVPRASASGQLSAPAIGARVRISFPLSGAPVELGADVRWRKRTATGAEVGLNFLDVAPTDQELIRQVVMAGT
jgi:hypothetical protein